MKVLTANRLTDGEAVWFATDRFWAETIARSEVAARQGRRGAARGDRQGGLRRTTRSSTSNLIDVELIDGEIVPLSACANASAPLARPTAPTLASRPRPDLTPGGIETETGPDAP